MLLRFTKGRESAILFGGNRRIPLCWHKRLEWLAKIDANDLPGDRLKNVIVVSTGMPQVDERIRAMQAYYDSIGEDGFFLSMTLPGMIRVIQAAGRLIRTDEDTGSLLLIDSRYRYPQIRALLSGTLIGAALEKTGG